MIDIQFLAMLTMLIDHVGAVWFPDQEAWRIIGRLSFPIYAYAMVLGYYRTSNYNRYLGRLALLAILSQLPYQLAFQTNEVNVIATLFVCLLLLRLLDLWSGQVWLQFGAVTASLLLLESIPFDYGAYAALLVLIFRYSTSHLMVLLHFCLNLIGLLTYGWVLQLFSLFTTMLIVYLPEFIGALNRIRVPRMLWRSFYPLHLTLIFIIYSLEIY